MCHNSYSSLRGSVRVYVSSLPALLLRRVSSSRSTVLRPMATTNPAVRSVQFTVNWKIKWSEFASIRKSDIEKTFITSYNNIPLKWRAGLFSSVSHCVGVGVYYDNGPIETFGDLGWSLSIVKSDLSIASNQEIMPYEASLGKGRGRNDYFDRDPVAVRAKYGLQESYPLVIRITLKIPISAFSYAPSASPSAVSPKWMIDLFDQIEDPDTSLFWNVKMISSDGDEFYCHKVIAIAAQSEPLQAIFRHPPPENEYQFPRLSSDALKTLIQYLYTGQVDLADLTTTSLIEVADVAEMFLLKPLKEACTVVLWKEVVEYPESCAEILRFADLHDDLKNLKNRAMDILAENYESLHSFDMFGNGKRGDRLRDQFHLFLSRRVEMVSAVHLEEDAVIT